MVVNEPIGSNADVASAEFVKSESKVLKSLGEKIVDESPNDLRILSDGLPADKYFIQTESVVPRGVKLYVNQVKWDRRFLELAEQVASWSKDPSTKVGAVIVNPNREVVGTGYNGFARGVEDSEERYNEREKKYKLIVHAETNAVLTAGHRAQGGTIYVVPSFGYPPLCSNCAKVVVQAGIARVVGWLPNVSDEVAERWKEELEAARLMCKEAGVEMTMLER